MLSMMFIFECQTMLTFARQAVAALISYNIKISQLYYLALRANPWVNFQAFRPGRDGQ